MFDVVIIGAGPAGLTAGLYAGRYTLNGVILEKASAGGQIIFSPTIDNFPGFPGGIATTELIDRMHAQVQEVGIGITMDEVSNILVDSRTEKPVYTVIARDQSYETRSVIVASGAQPKRLGVPGEDKFVGRGTSYCATCDGPLFKNKDIVVVGGGDRALEEAILLSQYGRKVTVIHRRQGLRASGILQKKSRANAKIEFMLDAVVTEVVGSDRVEGVAVRDVRTGAEKRLNCSGVFIFVGIEPATAFAKNLLHTDNDGFIITDQDAGTSRKGIFACGDCRRKSLYQVVSACSDGAVAAASAQKYLL